MKASCGVFAALFLIAASTFAQAPNNSSSEQKLPIWAYPVPPSAEKPHAPKQDDGDRKRLPGSTASYTKAQIADLFSVPDWFPDAHPPMPKVVSSGRKPEVYACGYCHLPNGLGRPENASIAGLPTAYIEEQMADFKNGSRKGSETRMASVNHMVLVAKGANDDEVKAAAEYFSSMKLKPWIRVVEVENAPKTRIAGGMLVLADGGGTEPIGERIIEVPENLERTELRDFTSGFVAYVPTGSLKRGEALVRTGGNGETLQCTMCHGADLTGMGNTPSIAGRSPSQMARQLIDFQTGARGGDSAQGMKGVVSSLKTEDIVAITAYLASLKP